MSDPGSAALLELQQADLLADRICHHLAALPEQEVALRTEQQAAAIESELVTARMERDRLAIRQQDLEAELEAAEARAESVRRRLYGGDVSASRELQAMSVDYESLRRRCSDLEDTALGVLEELEPLEARVSELSEALEKARAAHANALRDLAAAEEALRRELETVSADREDLARRVPPPLLSLYEELRSRLGGVVVTKLVANRCDGCHLTLSATEIDRIRRLPPGEAIPCEQCGRLLVL